MKLYNKDIILYHGTSKKNLKSILKNGLIRKSGDTVYIYTSPKLEIAKQYGDLIIEINGKGFDLRIWDTDKENQIMIYGNVPANKIKTL